MISPPQTKIPHEKKIVLCFGRTTLLAHKVSEFSEFSGCLTFLVSTNFGTFLKVALHGDMLFVYIFYTILLPIPILKCIFIKFAYQYANFITTVITLYFRCLKRGTLRASSLFIFCFCAKGSSAFPYKKGPTREKCSVR